MIYYEMDKRIDLIFSDAWKFLLKVLALLEFLKT